MSDRVAGPRDTPATSARRLRVHGREGGIVTGWLIQLVVFMAVLALVAYEVITVAVTAINLEDDAREVARAAAQAYGSRQNLAAATGAAETVASELEVGLEAVSEVDGTIRVDVVKTADTLLVHRLGPLEDLARTSATGRARWRP